MNNIEELKQELERHKTEIERIEKQLEEKKSVKRWRADKGGDYCFINDHGGNGYCLEINSFRDAYSYASGNYFQTKQEAENYKRRLLLTQQIKDIALELNDGVEIDWKNNDQIKYYFYWSFCDSIVQYFNRANKTLNAIYSLSDKFLETVQSRISEEDLLFLFKEEL